MSTSKLPERASLEYLKKLAKERLGQLRESDSNTKLAAAQLAIARDHAFPSWRLLKSEVERQQVTKTDLYFEACKKGDAEALRRLLASDPALIHATECAARWLDGSA